MGGLCGVMMGGLSRRREERGKRGALEFVDYGNYLHL